MDKNKELQLLKAQLNKENETYMRDLHGYLLISNVFSDEEQVMAQLTQLYSDVLLAQADGVSAEEFLGKVPKAMADELGRQFSRQRLRDFLWQTVNLFFLFEWVQGLMQFLFEGQIGVSPWLMVVDLVIAVLVPWLLFGLRYTFYRSKGASYTAFMLLGGLFVLICLGRGFLASQLASTLLPQRLSIILLLASLVGYLFGVWLRRR